MLSVIVQTPPTQSRATAQLIGQSHLGNDVQSVSQMLKNLKAPVAQFLTLRVASANWQGLQKNTINP
jgi:hypothetical protein